MKTYEDLYYSDDYHICLGPVDKKIKEIKCFHPDATHIADNAFENCQELKSVYFPDEIIIGKKAFSNCINLENISFLKSAYIIDSFAFSDCISLKQVEFPPTVIILEDNIFNNCNLDVLVMPKITRKKSDDFLKNCYIESIKVTGDFSVRDTINAKRFKISEDVCFSIKDDALLCDKSRVLLRYPCLKKEAPTSKFFKGLDSIERYAFKNCKFSKLNIDNINMENFAFGDLEVDTLRLTNIHFENVQYIFENSKIKNLILTNCTFKIDDFRINSLFGNADIGNIEISGGNFKIKNNILFADDTLLYSLNNEKVTIIPKNIKRIASFAFRNSLTKNIVFEENCNRMEIRNYCFSNNNTIERIFFDASTSGHINFSEFAFDNCKNLKEVYLPKNFIPYCKTFSGSTFDKLYISPNKILGNKEKLFEEETKDNAIKVIINDELASKNLLNFQETCSSFKEINNLYKQISR